MTDAFRFPAEWEPQSAVLIAWPHADTDWAERLADVEETYVALVAAITRFQPVVICVADDDLQTYAEARLRSARVDMAHVRFVPAEYGDTWLRDSGPITLRDGQRFKLLDFRFTGWGGKYEASRDDRLVGELSGMQLFHNYFVQSVDFALEGGAIETDGAGTLLTTWQCLHERHPDASREELTGKLAGWLKQQRVLWLDHGYLEGDDTDAHIDTLARFAPGDAIVYQACDDASDAHYAELQAMAADIAALRTADGRPYRAFPLPWARPPLPPPPPPGGQARDRRRAPPAPHVRDLPDQQRRRADAGLWRPCGRCRRRRAGAGLPRPRDRAGALPRPDLAERQPALHHHAAAGRPAGLSTPRAPRRAGP